LTTAERLSLFVEVCKAVQHAHQKGIIHRDIKPSNILVTMTPEGTALPVVIDFGIAKATTSQRLTDKTLFTAFEMLIGTPAYMSPEQAALTSVDVDTRTDIYSLGVLLYELLTGSTPFDSGELLKAGLDEIRRVIREKEPLRPSTRLSKMTGPDLTTVAQYRKSEPPRLIRTIRGDLDWIVMKALEKDRTRRYESAYGMGLDVQRFLSNETVSARPPGKIYKLHKTVLRNKLLFMGIGVITLFLLVSLIVVSMSLAKERQARSEANAALRQAETDKAQAQAEAAKSRQVTQFLEDMLQGVGPSVARGRDTTMLQEILNRTAQRVGAELTNQPSVQAELCSLIGEIYLKIGNYGGSEQMQRVALAINRKLFGLDSKEVALSQSDLGLALFKEGRLPEAENTQREALAIRRRVFGNDSAEAATTLNDLAAILRHEHRLTESESLARESIRIRQKVFGDQSLELADSLHNLSIVLGDEGKGAESEATARELLAMRRKLLGPEDPLVASALNDVAWAAGVNGKSDEAEALQREALAMQRKLLGDVNPDVVKTLSALSTRIQQRGNLTEADALLNAALSMQSKLTGENNPDFLYTLDNFATTLEEEGKWAEAEVAHRKALASWRKLGGNEDPRTLADLKTLVRDLLAQQKTQEAEQVLDEVLTPAFVSTSAGADLLVARIDLLGRLGRWQEAETNAILSAKYQPDDHYRQHTLALLLAKNHHRPEYEQLCGRILPQFADTSNPYIAERVADDCLLLPDSGVDLQVVDKLATRAVTIGNDVSAMGYFQACKALSEYRQAKYSEAVVWAEKTLKTDQVFAQAKGDALLAMAKWQLGDKAGARTILAVGDGLVPEVSATNGPVDLGDSWLNWLYARISLDEASALIQSGSVSSASSNSTGKNELRHSTK